MRLELSEPEVSYLQALLELSIYKTRTDKSMDSIDKRALAKIFETWEKLRSQRAEQSKAKN